MHQISWGKYLLLLAITLLGCLYAAPNLYGNDPAVQVSGTDQLQVAKVADDIKQALNQAQLPYHGWTLDANANRLLIRFASNDDQFKAQTVIQQVLREEYSVALNLAPAAPVWLRKLGAIPMKLGLDLQGGVHFLLEVDVDSVVNKRLEDGVASVTKALRAAHVRYADIARLSRDTLQVQFRDQETLDDAYPVMQKEFPYYTLTKKAKADSFVLLAQLAPEAIEEIRQLTLEQTMTILRNRVNELGVAEAVVQQQGADRVSVDLPGIQDTARAQRILGDTATLEFRLVNDKHDADNVVGGIAPMGTKLYHREDGRPILLNNEVVLSGKAIASASASVSEDGRPAVNISVSGEDVKYFSHVTARNIGKLMAIVYVNTKFSHEKVDGKDVSVQHKTERVISVAVIESGLGYNFVINGLDGQQEANNLALSLRSGALLAPVNIMESRLVGPSLGASNIHKGVVSLEVGMALVVVFMVLYYSFFGIIADIALLINLVLLTAILSVVGAVLTLPGIAGIVLTLGMAVDANVLIFERIREELRNGMSAQAAIHSGYERAMTTIVDANVTTLIVGMVLFALGSGPIKGFAVTLSLGILTSMLTGVTFTRAIVAIIYGNKPIKRLAIGI